MDGYLKRNLALPAAWRWAEGLSNAMLLGHLWAGGDAFSPLAVVYAVHWGASLNYHVRPCARHFEWDCTMIGVVVAERLYLLFPSPFLWVVSWLCLFVDDTAHPYVCFGKTALALATACGGCDRVSLWWVLFFVVGGFCYLVADWCLWASWLYYKSLAHIGFHACMACAAYVEVSMRPRPRRGEVVCGGVRLLAYGARVLCR